MVMNVEVMVISHTSVQVSWNNLSLTCVTGYTVYYVIYETNETELSVEVLSSSSTATIMDLINGKEYRFQVAGKAGNGNVGVRSFAVYQVITPTITPTTVTVPPREFGSTTQWRIHAGLGE